jgi:phasin family protein
MQNEIMEQLTNASKNSYATLQELGEINTKALKKLADVQFSLATLGIESGVEQAKLLSNTSNYKDLLATESELANQYGNKVMELTKQATNVLTESGEEITAWFEKSVEVFSETAKPAAKKPAATKKAS